MNLNSTKLSRQDKESLLQYTKHFIRKALQIIVQSRLGEKKPTKSRIHANNSDWFNLSIKDLVQITALTKATIGSVETIFISNSPFCIEISLKTPENQTMILETWCILFNDQLCDNTQKICFNVYKKMSLVLRSLLCMTRSMPTYQLSRRQSPDTYVLLYRMYCGEPIVHNLGEKYATAKAGTIATPIGSILLNVAYRTRLTMTPQNIQSDTIYIKDDHFKDTNLKFDAISSLKKDTDEDFEQNNIATGKTHLISELNEKSETKQRSQPIKMMKQNQFCESPTQNDESSEECSRNSSVASTPSDTMYYFKLKSAAFAPSSFNNSNKDLTQTSQTNEVPPFISLLYNEFSNLSTTTTPLFRNKSLQSPPPQNTEQYKSNSDLTSNIINKINEDDERRVFDQNSKKQTKANYAPQPDDFVFIESQKIAFGHSDAANDLSTFFRSCENAPILESFNTESSLSDTLKDLDQQLLSFESKVAEFDDLVKSLETN